jgi:alpha-amylase/alpha-mannosidase (GH57 family)
MPPVATTAPSAGNPAEKGPEAVLRYICIHGHFYQPPRENPWLETVEVQDSAEPYHDWNDRITAECYAPNGASRIVNKQNQIVRIVNNYSRMSFNFGPTLLSWLQENAPRTYRMVIDADERSLHRYGGHGSAMAQVYNHIILPLATPRDAVTQIRWGIADFEHRFGRRPEGMWLAETAVNRECLDLMAREGVRFTVLAPHQCARIRRLNGCDRLFSDDAPWINTPNASVNTTRAYRVPLDEGRSIAVFFYNGPISRAIAFEGLLNNGGIFRDRLMTGFQEPQESEKCPQLVSCATDGESYGHHHRYGEMALSYTMQLMEHDPSVRLTNYGEFLEKFPPEYDAEVVDNTSWSCVHGIERWRSNCGCNSGKPGWQQTWRTPLRGALDWLRDQTAPLCEKLAAPLFRDFWAARDSYISVILDRSPETEDRFFQQHCKKKLSPAERTTVLQLMELQRQSMLMYTSCGWFFDDISGIETVQIIAYASRLLQLAATLFGAEGVSLEDEFLVRLAEAKSNLPEIGNGAGVYNRFVKAMRIGLEQVGAHYAISSIFRSYPEEGNIFCYDVGRQSYEVFNSGRGRLAIGRAQIRSRITQETEDVCFAVLHLGDQNLSAAVRSYTNEDTRAFTQFTEDVREAITSANLPAVIRHIDHFFSAMDYSLTSLFADEERRILRTILNATLSEVENSLRTIYEDHASLLHFLTISGMPKPPALMLTASFALNASLRHAIEADPFDSGLILSLLQRARTDQVNLDAQVLGYAAGQRMKQAMVRLEAGGDEVVTPDDLQNALVIAETIRILPFEVNLWQAQNIWNDLLRHSASQNWSSEWKEHYHELGHLLNIDVDQLVVEESVVAF